MGLLVVGAIGIVVGVVIEVLRGKRNPSPPSGTEVIRGKRNPSPPSGTATTNGEKGEAWRNEYEEKRKIISKNGYKTAVCIIVSP